MIELLRTGTISVLGRHPHSSNQAFIVDCGGSTGTRAIYKPVAGERPLWDFPRGELARREVAAYAVSEALGFHLVPPTVWRDDAPFGPGSLQQWIEGASISDVDIVSYVQPGWRSVLDAELEDGTPVQVVHRDSDELRALALLDAVLNNGDRKAGHIIRDPSQRLWALDHGVTFHVEPKLRSVIWGFRGEPVPPGLLERLTVDCSALPEITTALDAAEIAALADRMRLLLTTGSYPFPNDEWPAIPWPIY